MKIKETLSKLKDTDVYSLILFALYKLKDTPEYSTLSELVYVLDKENLLKLCEYFGGLTIKIPTIEEIELLTYALVLYQWVNIDGVPYEMASAQFGEIPFSLQEVRNAYTQICNVINNYQFNSRA